MAQSLTSIIIPVIALIIALSLVAVLWYWWTSGQPETPDDAQKQPDQSDQPAQAGAPAGDFQARLGSMFSAVKSGARGLLSATGGSIEVRRVDSTSGMTSDGEMIEVLRLHRDLSTGALVVQIGRQKYYTLDAITDPQVRRRFLGNAEAMAQFAQLKKGTSPLIDWVTTSPPTQPQGAPPPPPQISQSSPVEPLPTPPPPATGAPVAATDSASGKKGKEEPKPKSMADEIEELLQYRLALDASFSRRSIHIRSSEDGTIFVEVDGATFDGISEVSDIDVRAFLQSIVQEWEARK
jgi:hypothetical protein